MKIRGLARLLAVETCIVLALVATAHAQSSTDQPRNEIEVRGTFSIPSGEASFSTSGSAGSILSFERDFDFQNEFGYALRYARRSESDKHKFLAEYTATSWDRSTTLSRSFTFRGETYEANLNATADLKLRTFRAMYAYRWGNDKIRVGPMVDIGVINTRLDISGTTTNGARSGEGSFSKFAATVGYDLDYYPASNVTIYNNLGGIAFLGDRLFRVEGGVKYFPVRHVGLSGGYRYQYVKLTDEADFLKVKINGPFFGGIFRF